MNRFIDHGTIWLDTSITVLCGFISILGRFLCFGIMADNHNVLHGIYYAPKTEYYVINWFLDHENIWLDTSMAVLCGFISILGRFICFGIMADNHNVLHGVYFTSKTESYVINWFLDLENIWLDTSITVLCGFISILGWFICFDIMAASDRARNPWKMHESC